MDGRIDGQKAYEAYRAHSEGKSLVSGKPIPAWDELTDEIREAWNAVASAVADEALRALMHRGLDRFLDAFTEAVHS